MAVPHPRPACRRLSGGTSKIIFGGVDLVTAAEIGGHARLDTLRIYTQPTDDDKLAALDHLTVDR